MVEPDTIRLLRECDAGIKMGVSAISDVVDRVADKRFRRLLTDCKAEHDKLKTEIQTLLDKYGDDGKDPNPIAKGMSHMKLACNVWRRHYDSVWFLALVHLCSESAFLLPHLINSVFKILRIICFCQVFFHSIYLLVKIVCSAFLQIQERPLQTGCKGRNISAVPPLFLHIIYADTHLSQNSEATFVIHIPAKLSACRLHSL